MNTIYPTNIPGIDYYKYKPKVTYKTSSIALQDNKNNKKIK